MCRMTDQIFKMTKKEKQDDRSDVQDDRPFYIGSYDPPCKIHGIAHASNLVIFLYRFVCGTVKGLRYGLMSPICRWTL